MINIRLSIRIIYINLVCLWYGIDEIILATRFFRPIRFLGFLSPFYWIGKTRHISYGIRIRKALEKLGPIFIKFGQVLSTRHDLLPNEITSELSQLQDRVPPFPATESKVIIEEALGNSIDNLFAKFEEIPMASASIAQVHIARLHGDIDVIVKVVRPGIKKIIRRDIDLLSSIAYMIERFSSEARRLRLVEVIREYEKTIFDELDLMREAANASQLRRYFESSEILYIPTIYWDYCRTNVMTMERIHGIPINQIRKLKEKGINMKLLSQRGVEIFFTQVFRDNFFHADMHPGNIFVDDQGRYLAIDFGIMGTLTEEDQHYLAENLLAFFNRDYRRVAQLHIESKWIAPNARVDEFESAIRTVSEPIFNKPLSEISFGYFLLRLFQTARRFNMEVQPQLVLLQKTLLNIEGLGKHLYPNLDLWATAKPFLEQWLLERVGPKASIQQFTSKQLPEFVNIASKVLKTAAERGKFQVNWESNQLKHLQHEIKESNKRLINIIASILLFSAALLVSIFKTSWVLLPSSLVEIISISLAVGGTLLLIKSWIR